MNDRRSFLKLGAATVGVAAVPLPALASHVTEPKRPIDPATIDFRVYKYPDLSTQVDWNSPNPTYGFPAARIETFIGATQDWPDRGAPSEHWHAKLQLSVTVATSGRKRVQPFWDGTWQHQNIPPHPIKPAMEWSQNTAYLLDLFQGPAQLTVAITGQESGIEARLTRSFTIAIP